MFFVAGANLFHLAILARRPFVAAILVGLRGYQMDRIRIWLDPWSDPLGAGFHTVQGLLALGVGGIAGRGLGQSLVSVPNAFNDFIFAEVGQEFGLVGAVVVDRPVRRSGVLWHPGRARRAGHLRCAAGGRHHGLAVHPGVHQHRASWSRSCRSPGITLPFLSAGGSSLIISFAAVGILLSISRETIEKGTWNDDATADRGRGNGRTHLPGAGRRPVAARSTGRR